MRPPPGASGERTDLRPQSDAAPRQTRAGGVRRLAVALGLVGTTSANPALTSRRIWWGPLGLMLLVAAAYGQTLGFDFVWEDHDVVFRGPLLRGRLTWQEIFTTSQGTYYTWMEEAKRAYRPLHALSLVLDHRLWGLRPAGFHLTSVLAHLAVVLLVWRLAWHLTASAGAAFFAGALLAVSPSAVEAAVFITGARMDLFVGLGMAAILLLLKRSLGPLGGWRAAAATGCFALALGSKETAMVIPAVVTWAAWVYPQWFATPAVVPRPGALAARVAPFWLALGFYAVLRHHATGGVAPVPFSPATLPARALRALVAIATYGEMTVIPPPVRGLYTVDPPTSFADWRVLAGALAALILIVAPLWLRRRSPAASLALGMYALGLLPASNIVPIYHEEVIQVAERSLYPALIGWCLFLAVSGRILWAEMRPRRRPSLAVARATGAVLVGILALVTAVKAGAWRDDVTLWKASLASHPTSFLTRLNLGWALVRAGELQEAQTLVQEITAQFPPDNRAVYLAGWVAEARGEPADALRHYERAVGLGLRTESVYRHAALLAARLGQGERAAHWFKAAADVYPLAAWPQVGLGWYQERRGLPALARAHFDQAARLEPTAPDRLWVLSLLLGYEGRTREAVQACEAALALDPSFLPARRALALVAEREGRIAEARDHWRRIAESATPGPERREAEAHLQRLTSSASRSTLEPRPHARRAEGASSASDQEGSRGELVAPQGASNR